MYSAIIVTSKQYSSKHFIQYSYRLYLRHIDQQMHRYLLQEGILHADETPVQVMKEPQKKNTSKSYMWLYTTGEFAQKQVRLFRYAPGRGQEYPVEFLKGFHGYLHTDGYAAYGGVADTTICMCWLTQGVSSWMLSRKVWRIYPRP